MTVSGINENRNAQAQTVEHISALQNEIYNLRESCVAMRKLLDEGTHKGGAVLNLVSGMKAREQSIALAMGDKAVLQQITEEQVDSLLELLKSPAFQTLARQLLKKWVGLTQSPSDSSA